MQAELIVDLLDLGLGLLQGRPQLGVFRIVEGDDGVQAVVAAGELDDDEDGVLGAGLVGGGSGGGRAAQEAGHGQAPADQAGAASDVFRKSRRFGVMCMLLASGEQGRQLPDSRRDEESAG